MLCENCKKNTATTYIKQTINGQTGEIFLCSACAKKLGMSDYTDMNIGFGPNDLLNQFFGFPSSGSLLTMKEQTVVCPFCSMTETEFYNTGKAGCEKCYSTFKDRFKAIVNKYHGNKKHVGKRPITAKAAEPKETVISLKKQLGEAIKKEDFEQAAVLRDKIKKLSEDKEGGRDNA